MEILSVTSPQKPFEKKTNREVWGLEVHQVRAYTIKYSPNVRKFISAYLSTRRKVEDKREETIEKIHEFHREGLSIACIAKKLKIDKSLVFDVLHNGYRDVKNIQMPPVHLLQRLYWKEKLSTRKIARLLGIGQRTVIRWMNKYKIRRRDIKAIAEARAKYKRRVFDSGLSSRAYMIGFVVGDCDVRWHSRKIRVKTSSTHPAQIKLFKGLFGSWISGFVEYQTPTKFKTYSWNVYCDLDSSFEFLIKAKKEIPEKIFQTSDIFLSFLAGFFDAEGCIHYHNNRGRAQVQIGISNKDGSILKRIDKRLRNLGYHPSCAYLSERDIWTLGLSRRTEVIALLQRLPLRHAEKVKKKRFLSRNQKVRFWKDIKGGWETLRNNIKDEVNNFCGSYAH